MLIHTYQVFFFVYFQFQFDCELVFSVTRTCTVTFSPSSSHCSISGENFPAPGLLSVRQLNGKMLPFPTLYILQSPHLTLEFKPFSVLHIQIY